MDSGLPRRLAAILYADAADYTRLTRADEDGTHQQLSACLDVFGKTIEDYHGRVVHFAGDAVLAEFPSVSQALACAAVVQSDLAQRNADLPAERRIRFRIGVNLGEVIVDRNDIYGDGVNVAARLQSLAGPDEILVPEAVRNAVGSGLPFEYEFLGKRQVRHLHEPLEIFRLRIEPGVALPPATTTETSMQSAARTSIAVLPFDNLSGDPEQQYFADGLTDDLITDLAKIPSLLMIARNSSFRYRDASADIKQVGRELGVRYVLEGSVRRSAGHVRVNAQLIDTMTGGHVWADRFDERIDSLLDLQERITAGIASTLAIELGDVAQRQEPGGTRDTRAYDDYLRGWALYNRETPEDFARAIPYFENALQKDPEYGRARAALALTYIMGSERGLSRAVGLPWHVIRTRGRGYLAAAMQRPTVIAHLAAAFLSLKQRLWADAVGHAEAAVGLEPSNAGAHSLLGYVLNYASEPERAIEAANHAMRLDPLNPSMPMQWIGRAQFALGNFAESLRWLERAHRHNPTVLPATLMYAAANALLGRRDEARAALVQYREAWVNPPTVKQIMYFWPFRDAEVADWFARGILDAGLEDPDGDYYQVAEHDRLDSQQISALLADRSVRGSDPWAGRAWTREYRNGTVRWQGDACNSSTWHGPDVEADTGSFTIRDDLVYERWNRMHAGIETCFPVFRNPAGTQASDDEYLFMTDTGILAWSRTS